MNSRVTEIVEFGKKQGIKDKEFICLIGDVIKFYEDLPGSGYIKTKIVKNSDDLWILLMDWESRELEKKASNLMVKSRETEKFRDAIDLKRFNKRIFDVVTQ